MTKEDFLETINIFDPDKGPCINNLPLIGGFFDKTCEKYEDCSTANKTDKYGFVIGGAGVVGGGLLGYKLGENFGTLGKLAGGVVGAWAGCKLAKETAKDIAAASDYVENNSKDGNKSKISKFEASIKNIATINGQAYDGKTKDVTETDSDLDAT